MQQWIGWWPATFCWCPGWICQIHKRHELQPLQLNQNMSKKGAGLRYGIRCFFSWMQCSGFAFVEAPMILDPNLWNFAGAFSSQLMSARNREISVLESSRISLGVQTFQKLYSLFHPSQALLTYLAVEKKACNFNPRTQKFPCEKTSGKWEKLEIFLLEKQSLWGCKACSLMLIGFGILFDLHGWPTVVGALK